MGIFRGYPFRPESKELLAPECWGARFRIFYSYGVKNTGCDPLLVLEQFTLIGSVAEVYGFLGPSWHPATCEDGSDPRRRMDLSARGLPRYGRSRKGAG